VWRDHLHEKANGFITAKATPPCKQRRTRGHPHMTQLYSLNLFLHYESIFNFSLKAKFFKLEIEIVFPFVPL
jgi:hypothetical protein